MDQFQFGLIGYPLGHSRSPAIHTAGLRALGLSGEYRLYPVRPLPEGAGDLHHLVKLLRRGEIHGLNITIPHKQSVLPLLDQLTPTAQAIGAVNTLMMANGLLVGENTDAPGFLADLELNAPDVIMKGGRALVLGAEGAARAIVHALTGAGFEVIIAARHLETAQKIGLSARLSITLLDTANLADLVARSGAPITLLVNATSVGTSPNIEVSPWPESVPFPVGAVVYDLVYNPLETQLARQARQSGLYAFTGLGMLIEQAALAFELWTGQPAPREIMRQAVEQV